MCFKKTNKCISLQTEIIKNLKYCIVDLRIFKYKL